MVVSPTVICALLVFSSTFSLAAPTLSQQIDPPEANVGDQVTINYTVQNGGVEANTVHFPSVEGIQVLGTSIQMKTLIDNGALSSALSFNYIVTPTRAGDLTIPAFDIPLQDGGTLHTKPLKLHVLSANTAPPPANTAPNNPGIPSNPPASAPPIPPMNGPVVMPPNNPATPPPPDASANGATTPDTTSPTLTIPKDADGTPARVFMNITLQTTDAYVGQSIPMRIEWYIRRDVCNDQNSLPTIKGSDFMMNELPDRLPPGDLVPAGDYQYIRESWVTAVTAPKSGDFQLQMERDSYWVKNTTTNIIDIFGNRLGNQSLAHEMIPSNQLMIHVHPLPTEGRPSNFTGAIGDLKVTSNYQPDSVALGEPVTLRFIISGQGNFDYIHCPTLASDPDWKSYAPSSKTEYNDDSKTVGTKTFEQAMIPQKNGNVPLPQASFSYFNPTTKQYVIVPINLPTINVTGTVAAATPASPSTTDSTTPASNTPAPTEFFPNRAFVGYLQPSLMPVYRQPWFWAVQGGLACTVALFGLLAFVRSGNRPVEDRAGLLLQQQTLHQEQDAMGEAVRNGDALAFFTAARHAIQLQLGTRWKVSPEALTIGEIAQRDPQLAETLEPLFTQASEVIYSGRASGTLDLAQWERHVRDLLQQQLQPA